VPGSAPSEAEVTNISKAGFWLLIDGRELFSLSLSFRGSGRRQWRRSCASTARLPDTFTGPTSTIDLPLDSIEHPERYPLKSKT
jgi:hypothetical protein